MSIREKYKLAKIRTEIENFSALIDAELFDEAVKYFREHLERPTLFGLEPSLRRAELLQKVEVEKLSDNADKCLILYSLALSLNLTGGYPNRAIPLYEKHDELAEKLVIIKVCRKVWGITRRLCGKSGVFGNRRRLQKKGCKLFVNVAIFCAKRSIFIGSEWVWRIAAKKNYRKRLCREVCEFFRRNLPLKPKVLSTHFWLNVRFGWKIMRMR